MNSYLDKSNQLKSNQINCYVIKSNAKPTIWKVVRKRRLIMKESDIVEFKSTFINDLNKEIIAFANTKGGDIYIGINDDGSVCGVENIEETELKCTGHIRDTIKPDISM